MQNIGNKFPAFFLKCFNNLLNGYLMKTFILLIFFTALLLAQNTDDKVLARIGEKKITLREFTERYELTPQIGRHNKNREEYLKEELLYSMIAEKLWALESGKLNLDTTEIMKYTFTSLQKMYWRDALYAAEVKNKVSIDPNDYVIARQRSAWNLNTKYLFADKETEIDSLHKILLNGFPFDTLLAYRSENSLQSEPYVIYYGKMEQFVEDTLYKLKPGKFSSPLKSPEGWYIFKVESIEQNIISNEKQAKELEKTIKRVIEARATNKAFDKFVNPFFKDMNVVADGEVFWSFSNKVIDKIKARKIKANIKDGEKVALIDEDFNSILKEIPSDTLNMVFIKFEKNPITLREFLHDFFFEGFFSNIINENILRAKLNSRVKLFIEKEILAREALAKNLNNNDEVKHFLDMWRDNYLSSLFRNTLLKDAKVTDAEVLAKYNEQNKTNLPTMQVNIIEVLTDSLEIVENILTGLDKGVDLGTFAKRHTKRTWTKEKNGEFGFFPTNAYGEIGRIASEMEIGETYGPLKTDDGYSIFKLIGKKEATDNLPKPFEEIQGELKKQLKLEKLSEKMIDKTVELANKYGVSVDEQMLKSVQASNLSMVVYRYMGFGGRILAVPYSAPFTNWVQKWKQENKLP